MAKKFANTFEAVQSEIGQSAELRQPYLKAITTARSNRTVVSFFMSFGISTPLDPDDADQFEEILCNANIKNGITLLLDAPGGDGLTAERIIQICRSYSKGDFETIVAARAKSAATMVCLGSDRILMSPTSELGPIDPQVPMDLSGSGYPEWVAAHHITKAYDELFDGAKALTDGHIEPYLQQLTKFNAVKISQLKAVTNLAEQIAVNALSRGMLKGKTSEEIKNLIKPFTDPDITMSHGRGIDLDQALNAGLNVEKIELDSDLWAAVRGLYVRSKYVVDAGRPKKLIETLDGSYLAG